MCVTNDVSHDFLHYFSLSLLCYPKFTNQPSGFHSQQLPKAYVAASGAKNSTTWSFIKASSGTNLTYIAHRCSQRDCSCTLSLSLKFSLTTIRLLGTVSNSCSSKRWSWGALSNSDLNFVHSVRFSSRCVGSSQTLVCSLSVIHTSAHTFPLSLSF